MLTQDNIVQALLRLRPGAEFAVGGDALTDIDWQDGSLTQPTDQQVTDECAVVQAEKDAELYLLNRNREYVARGVTPEAMLDALWANANGDSSQLQALQAIRDQVDAEYPQPQQT